METHQHWTSTPASEWQRLADAHDTPYYLYDADVVNQRIHAVRDALHGQAQVYYAVKANPNLALLRALTGVADGADISSAGELAQALLAGFDAARMSFAGPAKTAAELEAAVRAGVGAISLESLRELDECARVAERAGRRARVLLRVNPLLANRLYGVKMGGGKPVQFGFDEEALPAAEARLLVHADWLDFRGIHVYVGSQCFDPMTVAEATRNALRIAGELEQRSGLRCAKINLGGGFGVAQSLGRHFEARPAAPVAGEALPDGASAASGAPPAAGETAAPRPARPPVELGLPALSALLVPVLAAHRAARPWPCELIFELGRYLTAEAGIYVTRVVGSKASRGKLFFTCDGGLHHQLAAAGTFGAALRGNFPLRNLSRPGGAPVTVCSLAGPSCNPTDLLGVDVELPAPEEGDLLGVLMSGAYGLTASPLLFLGRPTPVELVRSGGDVVVGRRSRVMADFN